MESSPDPEKSIMLDCPILSIMRYSFYNHLKSADSTGFLLLILIVYYTVKQRSFMKPSTSR